MKRLVCGYGVNDYIGYIKINGKNLKSYDCWRGILRRCFDKNVRDKEYITENISVCNDWLYFSNFKKWYDEHYIDSYVLDKDLLNKGDNKVYSPETCIFIPKEVDNFIQNMRKNNTTGARYIKVDNRYDTYYVAVTDFITKKKVYYGCFKNIEDAKVVAQNVFEEQVEKVKEYMRSLGYSENITKAI